MRESFLDMTDLVAGVRDHLVDWEPCTWHGRIYGLPSLLSGSAYYYRPDVFSELGIDPTKFDTWDDFIRAGREVKRSKGAYMLALDTSGYNQYQPLALHGGGGWFDASGRSTLDSEANIKALELYRDLLLKHEIAMPTAKFYGPDTWQAYRDGKLVGAYMPEWYGANEMRNNLSEMAGTFRITLAPAFYKGGARSGFRGGMCASVVRGPNEDVAFEFIRYVRLERESQIAAFRENFIAPSIRSAYDDPRVRAYEYSFLGGQKVAQVYAQIAREIRPFHVGEQLMEVQQLINSHVVPSVTAGKTSPKDALAEAAAMLTTRRIPLEEALKLEGDVDLRRGGDEVHPPATGRTK
jgi:ABC-type glycerol-3-phosphate transport system substrate-binding protein